MIRTYLSVISAVLVFGTATAWANPCVGKSEGYPLVNQMVKTVTIDEVNQGLQKLGIKIPASFAVELYHVQYCMSDWEKKMIAVSGAYLAPVNPPAGEPKKLLSYQHGTLVERALSPSGFKNDEMNLAAAAVGITGMYVTAADYIGLGISLAQQPYLHKSSQAKASRDIIAAVETSTKSKFDSIYLTGYSQGGHSTVALFEVLADDANYNTRIAGVIPMAGPYSLSDVSLVATTKTPYPKVSAAFVALMTLGYNQVYKISSKLDLVFTKDYAAKLPVLFDGTHNFMEIVMAMPNTPEELFQPDFYKSMANGGQYTKGISISSSEYLGARFYRTTKLNNTLGSIKNQDAKKVPFYILYSSGDTWVVPENSIKLSDELLASGYTDVVAEDVSEQLVAAGKPGLSHADGAMPSMIKMFQWVLTH